jgi:hypothetical protein
VLQYPALEGPTPCWVLVLQNEQSKANQQGNLLYSGAMGHRNPRLCTMGPLAQYLFWRWHISVEPAPNFQRRQDWYMQKVLVGEQPTEELAYSTHYDACLSAFQKVGINLLDLRLQLTYRPYLQIKRAGHWETTSIKISFLSRMPAKFIRRMAGSRRKRVATCCLELDTSPRPVCKGRSGPGLRARRPEA